MAGTTQLIWMFILPGPKQRDGKGVQLLHEEARGLETACAERHDDRFQLGHFGFAVRRHLPEGGGSSEGSGVSTHTHGSWFPDASVPSLPGPALMMQTAQVEIEGS